MARLKNNQIFGNLEAEIMEIIWKLKSASVRQVLTEIRKKRKVAYTTVMTVMTRLADKGILRRKFEEGDCYIYKPIQDKESFIAVSSRKMIKNLINEFGEVVVAQFIDAVETSNLKDLSEWQKKLKRIK